MRTDAEKGGTPIWATDGDDRVTRVGRFIRKTRLDELPQLWNVIRGDMSFVGPRPERPFFVAELAKEIPFYQQRHAVKPGLTGWAQVKYRYGSSLEDAMEKLRYDLYYIKHLSVVLRPDDRVRHGQGRPVPQGGGVTDADRQDAVLGTRARAASWRPSRATSSTRYLAIAAETALGLVMLPFNLAHLGTADYGLWVLLGSITDALLDARARLRRRARQVRRAVPRPARSARAQRDRQHAVLRLQRRLALVAYARRRRRRLQPRSPVQHHAGAGARPASGCC